MESVEKPLRPASDWLWAAASFALSILNLSYVLKEMAGGYVDPLLVAGITTVVMIVCGLLSLRYMAVSRATSAFGQNTVTAHVSQQRRMMIALSAIPILLCVVVIGVVLIFGKTALFAPADIRPFENRPYMLSGGFFGVTVDGAGISWDYCKDIHKMSPLELGSFANLNYGVSFRLQKRPTVRSVDIAGVRLTVQDIEEAPRLRVPAAGAETEPVAWAIEIPEDVVPGQKVYAQLLRLDFTPPIGETAVFSNNLPYLPNEHALPFIVRITCKKECLIYYKLEVLTDAGWRSCPIEVCDEVCVAFYKEDSEKLHYLNGNGPLVEPANQGAAPAPAAPAPPSSQPKAPAPPAPPTAPPAPAKSTDSTPLGTSSLEVSDSRQVRRKTKSGVRA